MCLAIPMRLVSRSELEGTVAIEGVSRCVSLMLLPEAEIGDYLLIHAGYAIGRLDEEEARLTLAYLEEAARDPEPTP